MIEDKVEFRRQITELLRQGSLAAEYAGNAGNLTKQASEKFGLDRRAIGLVKGLAKRPPAKRDAIVVDYLEAMFAAGFFDHATLSEDGPRELLLQIADLVRQAEPEEAAVDLKKSLDEVLD